VERINPNPSKTEGSGIRKFNGVRFGDVEGYANRGRRCESPSE